MAAEEKKRRSAFLHALLRWLSYAALACAAMAALAVLALRISPTPWGWSFIAIAAITMATSALGPSSSSFSSPSSSSFSSPSSRCGYGVYSSLLVASVLLQGSLFLLFLSRPSALLARLQAQRGASDARLLLKIASAALLCSCSSHLLLLSLSCLLHRCSARRPSAPHGYVDLEAAAAMDPSDRRRRRPFFPFSVSFPFSRAASNKRNPARVQEVAAMDPPKPSAAEGKPDMSKKTEQKQMQESKNGSEDGCKKSKGDPRDEKEEEAAAAAAAEDGGKSTGHV
jgi:hypothetical protein